MISFIKELQKSDDAIKKRWLIILTSASAALVIVVWVWYLNATITSVLGSPAENSTESRPGIIKIFSAGLSIVASKTVSGLANSYLYFDNKAKTKNSFSVDKKDHRFIYQGADIIPLRPLP